MCVPCLALRLVGVWEESLGVGGVDVTPDSATDQLCSWRQVPATLHLSFLVCMMGAVDTLFIFLKQGPGETDLTAVHGHLHCSATLILFFHQKSPSRKLIPRLLCSPGCQESSRDPAEGPL